LKVSVNNKLLLTVFVIMLSMALIARDVFSLSVNKFILLGICTIFLFVADETTKISMISFLLPLMCGIPSTYVLLVIMCLLAIRNRFNATAVLYFVLFIAIELLGLAASSMSLNSNVIKQMLFVCVFFALLFTVEKVDYLQCMLLYFCGAILVCGVISAYSLMRAPADWLSLFAKGWYRFGDVALEEVEGMTLRLNSNSLAYFSLTGMLQGIILLTRVKKTAKGLVFGGVLFLAIAGVLSVSRSWILVTIGCLILLLFSQVTNPKHMLALCAGLVITGFGGYYLSQSVPELFQGIITRMTHSSIEGGNGRVDLMVEYFDLLFENARALLLGVGATYYRTAYGMTTSIHNGTMQVFLCYGLIGGGIFIIGMLMPLRKSVGEKRVNLIHWLPWIGTVVFVQTIQFLNPCYLMLPYIISVYAVKQGRASNKVQ